MADASVPGPGSYSIPGIVGREGQPVSMKGKNEKERSKINQRILIYFSLADLTGYIPGPGAYQPKLQPDKDGRYFVSSLKSVPASTFGGPAAKSPRFTRERGNYTPGPGSYNFQLGVGENKQFSISSMRSPAMSTFYHSDRKIFEISKDHGRKCHIIASSNPSFLDMPGPGKYQAPSEFGIYASKHK